MKDVCVAAYGRAKGGINGFIPLKLPKLVLTADAEYIAHLVNANVVVNVQ